MRAQGKEVFGIQQNTDKWLSWRDKGVGGSEAAVIKMGKAYPFGDTPTELWKRKRGLSAEKVFSKEQQVALDRGHELEPEARARFIKETGIWVEPAIYEHAYYPFIRASLDGMNEERNIVVEIKCPIKRSVHDKALSGEVVEYYYVQIQQQLAVTGADYAFFFSYFPDAEPEQQTALILVKPNHAFIEDLLIKIRNFWKHVEQGVPPSDEYEFSLENPNFGILGLVQIAGYARSGKDTTARALEANFESRRFGYADPLKDVARNMGVYSGKASLKEKERPALIALGAGMRAIYPDVWVKGLYKPENGIFDAIQGLGAIVSDCRYVNEHIHGKRVAGLLNVPYRLIWVEKPGVPPRNEEEATATRHLRGLANIIVHNDVVIHNMSEDHFPVALERAVLSAIGQGLREVKASDFDE